jgi:hypothetical protein
MIFKRFPFYFEKEPADALSEKKGYGKHNGEHGDRDGEKPVPGTVLRGVTGIGYGPDYLEDEAHGQGDLQDEQGYFREDPRRPTLIEVRKEKAGEDDADDGHVGDLRFVLDESHQQQPLFMGLFLFACQDGFKGFQHEKRCEYRAEPGGEARDVHESQNGVKIHGVKILLERLTAYGSKRKDIHLRAACQALIHSLLQCLLFLPG